MMNNKLILSFTLILALFLMIGAVSAEGWFDFFNGNNSSENDNETFIVGVGENFPPFLYDDNGEYSGFDIELAKEVAKRNNWTIKFLPVIDWDTKEFELNSNEIDCIWSELTINGREDEFTWSSPYFKNTQDFVVRSNDSIDSLDDLKGKVVEVVVSSSVASSLNGENKSIKDTFAKVHEVNDYNSAFVDLKSGVCDAIICDGGYSDYQIKDKFSDGSLKILDKPLAYEEYGIGFKKGNDDLKNQVQKTLDEMFKDGTVGRIAQNYTEYNIPDGIIHPF